MKNLFFDTNFIVDYFLRDEYFTITKSVLEKAIKNNLNLFVSYLSGANFAYVARRLPQPQLYNSIENLLEIFEIVENDKTQILSALELKEKDFEDILPYQSALHAHCDCIITRNPKDFSFSKIPFLIP